jgi:hypothetical protein
VARRYSPLLVVVALELAVIWLWPSTPLAAGGRLRTTQEATGSETGTSLSDAASASGSASGSASAPGGTTAASAVAAGKPGARSAKGVAAGDRTHCVGDRQFDPALDFYAPPCVPTWAGDNGGATYRGVTGPKVKVVEYIPKENAALTTITKSAGKYETPEQRQQFRSAAERVINERFELYGRRLQIVEVQGTCAMTPPDVACLRNELRGMVADQQPLAVIFVSACSACIDELAHQGVVVVGDQHYSASFATTVAPYFWGAFQGGTRLARLFGQFWCTNLSGRPAQYAANHLGNTNGQQRRLGVIGNNDPQTQVVVNDLKAELAACGDRVAAEYYYSPDLSTASQQAQAGIDIMRNAHVTSTAFFSDPVGPALFYSFEQSNNYYPEPLVSGFGLQDTDLVAQGYSKSGGLGCPAGKPCPSDTAVGVGPTYEVPVERSASTNVWRAAGNQGLPPSAQAVGEWERYRLVATLLQAGGPMLTPVSVEHGVRRYGSRGDDTHPRFGFDDGGYFWVQDTRIAYWDTKSPSPYNGQPGSYIKLGGRVRLGEFHDGMVAAVPAR